MQFSKILIFSVGLLCAGVGLDAKAEDAKKGKGGGRGTTTAAPKGMKARHLNGEASMKSKDQSKVDFEAADIGGERKAPLGTLINQNKADKNFDFVKIRLRWHPEMVQSASSLDNGAGK
jgi:hypothetical protein